MNDTATPAFIWMASCENAIASIKLRYYVLVYTPKVVPIIVVGHRYQPASVIVPLVTQIGFKVTSALLPTVAMYSVILIDPSSSLLMKSVVLIGVCYWNVTFHH
jgi:hypothetical protein